MKLSDLHNKRIAILGFGKEGQSSLDFLCKQGITGITVLDKNPIITSPFGKGSTAKQGGIKYITGESYLENLEGFDLILKSPGVSPFQEKLLPYRDKFISQTQIFFDNYTGKVIGLTGTKGKSTCSTLLYELLISLGHSVILVGNIGKPVLEEIDLAGKYEYIIYELSSYMLQDFSPMLTVGYLNNIYPCHLDWHYDSLNIYKEAKINILKNADIKIIHGDLWGESEIKRIKDEKIFFDTKGGYTYNVDGFLIDGNSIYTGDIALNGEHNKKNIAGIIAILSELGVGRDNITKALGNVLPVFGGLPHRIEDIGTYEGIRYINDAIATTPQSTIAAINTFDGELETIFLGGEDSGFDFTELRERILNSSIKNIIAFPDTVQLIFPEIEMRDYEQAFELEIEGKQLQFLKTKIMRQAVDFSYKTTLPGKISMLSSGAPSFSLWSGYLEKAKEFISAVQKY